MPSIAIDEILFAHINNDPFLTGTYKLQGTQFEKTIRFLNQFIENDQTTPEAVKRLLKNAYKELVSYEQEINKLAMSGAVSINCVSKLAKDFHEAIKKLQGEEYLLFPGGWQNVSGGHAIIYQLSLNQKGDLLFSSHNSGSGLTFHFKKSDPEKNLYHPVLTYRIPKQNIPQEDFTDILIQFIAAQIPSLHIPVFNQDNLNADDLYQRIFTQFSHLDGEIIPPEINADYCYTAGQLSGTCTQRVLHQMLKANFSSLDAYRRFIYRFKTYALDQYMLSFSHSIPLNLQGQINKAIRHQLRLLNAFSRSVEGEDLFPADYKHQEVERLQHYLEKLGTPKPTQKKRVQSKHIIGSAKNFVICSWKPSCDGWITSMPMDLRKPLIVDGGSKLLSNLDALVVHCNHLNARQQNQTLFEQLEHFFLHLPLPQKLNSALLPFYLGISSEKDARQFYQQIDALQSLYFECIAHLMGKYKPLLPRMYLVKISLFAVVGHINHQFKISSSHCFHDYCQYLFHSIIPGSINAPYLATENPEWDQRLAQLQQLYPLGQSELTRLVLDYLKDNEQGFNLTLLNYYQSILQSDLTLFAILQTRYLHNYSTNLDDFHIQLRQLKFTALFYFTAHRAQLEVEAKEAPQWQQLLDRFYLQEVMEKIYAYGNFSFEDKRIQIELCKRRIAPITPFFRNHAHLTLQNTPTIKYTLPDSSPAYALKRDIGSPWHHVSWHKRRNDNHVQLFPGKFADNFIGNSEKEFISQHTIDAQALEERELFHLRRCTAMQISLSLDYFYKHIEKLSRRENQVYLEANILQPGLLLEKLNSIHHEQFWQQFNLFIERGLDRFKHKELLSLHSVFFIRLSYLVIQYAAKQSPLYCSLLDAFLLRINTWIAETTDVNITASLHQYRFLIAVTQFELKSSTNLANALISYFTIQAKQNTKDQLDIDTLFKIQCAKHAWMRIIRDHQTEINFQHLLPQILREIGITITQDVIVSGDYPQFEINHGSENYVVEVEQGRVYQDEFAYGITPLHISMHPVLEKLGIKNVSSCLISADGEMFQIQKDLEVFRFFTNKKALYGDKDRYFVQKRWLTSEGIAEWYKLLPSSEQQRDLLQLSYKDYFAMEGYPKILRERDSLVWVGTDSNRVLLTENNQPIYEGYINSGLRTCFDKASLIGTTNTWIHGLCQAFEDSEFVIVTESPRNDEYIANLARYALRFSISKQDKTLYFQFEGKRYQYQEGHELLGQGVASMHFREGDRDLCLLPIQRFINANARETDGEYYCLQQDIGGIIADKIVMQLLQTSNPLLWQYSNTEQYFALPMKNGNPIPNTSAEALYLCYLYLASNQATKAWQILEDCENRLGGLAGQYDEIRFLNWICNALPVQLSEADKEAVISTPPFVACKLKALALLAGFSERGKSLQSIDFPLVLSVDGPNAIYRNQEIESTKSFYKTLNTEINRLYTRAQAMRRDLPIIEEESDFLLSDKETQRLLYFYHQHLPNIPGQPKAIGALGYEWVSLHLKVLHKEYITIEAIEKVRGLTPFEQGRKADILGFITQHEGVGKTQSDLEYRPINLSLPGFLNTGILDRKIIEAISRDKRPLTVNTCSLRITESLSKLRPSMKDPDFITQFPHYLFIATKGSPAEKAQLNHFCQAILIANRHVRLEKQTSNIPLLCNVLYRIMGSPLVSVQNCNAKTYEALFLYVQELSPPPLMVPQLIDKTEGLLVSTEDLWKSIPQVDKTTKPLISAEAEEAASQSLFSETSVPPVLTIKQQWQAAYELYQTGGDISLESKTAGKARLNALAILKQLANAHFADDFTRTNLQNHAKNRLFEIKEEQKLLHHLILALGNKGLEANLRWQIDVLALKCKPLDMTQLLKLYFHGDSAEYVRTTQLALPQIQELHEKLIAFVTNALRCQQLERILQQLEAIALAKDEERSQEYFQLAEALFSDNVVNAAHESDLSLFQYYGNILLRPQQKELIARLLETPVQDTYTESVIKMIMGGGKSKVFLPILAQKKATGSNLVILEVPKALLRTNFVDLKATSIQLFKQNAHLFEFNRDSECSPERLEQLYHLLSEIMVNRDYLVTTGDALQSLELKYLELLSKRVNETDEKAQAIWKKQIYWADKLLLLLRNRGDLIIDEVHQGLLLKNKLNYTLDSPTGVTQNILKYIADLYQFFQEVTLDSMGLPGKVLYDVILNNQLFTQTAQFTQAMHLLAQALVNHFQSPLHELIAKFSHIPQIHLGLKQYLLNETEIPECISKPKDKELLALYKEQINHLLPMTLKRNYGEHYGPSKKTILSPELRTIAIPYMANNVPNERCRFRSWLETANFSTQSLIINGLSKELIKQFADNLIIKARNEFRDYPHIDQTPSANLFAFLQTNQSKQWKLSEVDTDNEVQMEEITQYLCQNKSCIFEVLKQTVLKHVRRDTRILHSDAFNHVDIVRSCQGMSGTPSNYSTYHQRLCYDEKAALGTDEYIMAGLHAKNPTIHPIDFQNTESFINLIFAPYQAVNKLRAIIDISASFKGIDNFVVAKEIAHYIALHSEAFSEPKSVRYILYFNEFNQLSAIPVALKTQHVTSIVIGSSDPNVIKDRLGCNAEERFTFYDQAHSVGTDIKQYGQAKGIAMIEPDTDLSNFLQGIMRLRSLISGEQVLDLVVPTSLSGKTLDNLLEIMGRNEQQRLRQDNFEAARLRMINLIRSSAMQRILGAQGEDAAVTKQQLFGLFATYFIEEESAGLFAQYGGLDRKEDTKDILAALQIKLFENWKDLMRKANPIDGKVISAEESNQLNENLSQVVNRARKPGVCESKQWRRLQVGTEVETQVQVEVFTEKEVQKTTFNLHHQEMHFTRWIDIDGAGNIFKTLNDICKTTKASFIPEFNQDISASKNFYLTHSDTSKLIDIYSKPVHGLLFKKRGEVLTCVLLTQQECEDLIPLVNKEKPETCWIGTTQHTILAGIPPVTIKANQIYQQIIEQVRYFNGDFQLLLEKDVPLNWLGKDSEKKIIFFEQYLQACRETSFESVRRLGLMLSRKTEIYQEIVNNPAKDLRQENWSAHFPDIEQEDIEELNNIANAFFRASTAWGQLDLTSISWQKDYRLPLMVMGYLSPYIAKMNLLRALIFNIAEGKSPEEQPLKDLIVTVSQQGVKAAERFLNSTTTNRDYQLLVDLANEIPPVPKARHVLLASIAQHQSIDAEHLEQLLNYIDAETTSDEDKKAIVWRLLINASDKITSPVFNRLIGKMCNEAILFVIAQHRLLCKDNCIPLLQKSAPFSSSVKEIILTLLLQHKVIDDMNFEEFMNWLGYAEALSPSHINTILQKFEGAKVLQAWVDKISNVRLFKIIIDHDIFDNTNRGVLKTIIKRCDDESVRLHCLKHPQADISVYQYLLEHNPSQTHLNWLAEYAQDIGILQEVLEKAPAAIKAELLKRIIFQGFELTVLQPIIALQPFKACHVQALLDKYPDLLKIAIEKASDSESFTTIIHHSTFTQANATLLQTIIDQCDNETVRMHCLRHKQANATVYHDVLEHNPTQAHLNWIAAHVQDPRILLQVLEKAPFSIKAELLELMIDRGLDITILQPIIESQSLKACHVKALLDKYPVLFRIIVEKASDNACFKIIVEDPLFDQADAAILHTIMSKCDNATVLMHCLQHEQANEATYQFMLNYVTTPIHLKYIAQHSQDLDTLQHLFELTIHKEDTLVAIANNQNATPKLLKQLAQSNPSISVLNAIITHPKVDESLLHVIVDFPAVTESLLRKAAEKTSDAALLAKIEKHPLVKKEWLDKHPLAVKVIMYKLLDELKIKTQELISKGNPAEPHFNFKYQQVAESAKILNDKLHKTYQTFFETKSNVTSEALNQFKSEVRQTIKGAKMDFARHRGTWYGLHPILRKLLGILSGITVLPALGVMIFTKQGYQKTFFTMPATDALTQLQFFEDNVEKQQLLQTSKSN